ncbi:dihydrofolate reductase family protein [Cohnella nanjingensis]|uniref:Dihydrofolate reductase family protein n=1 Tax=Cohnella nanjingensis TaxID=1387779 RepID=A0A7X0VFD3_9BACL|nr:dihydrofolate reductase family protein [Cohnella nanjingensis]MBB6671935.1 dihydrofolate reductase family protein [Cohnella nanjingensis]
MRKVIVQQFVTLDGVMQAPGDPNEFEYGGWQKPYTCEDHLSAIVEQAYEAEALLLGRKTYEGFAAAWPSMTGMQGLADRMNSMPKYVASKTLAQAEWNATLIRGDLAQEVAKLKEQPGRDLLVVGSGDLVQTLMKHRLVDEYRLWVYPVVLGRGERLFREGSERFDLRFVDAKTLSTGGAILTYRPAYD